jgi:adenine phosphoribosyltransferase
MTDLKKAIRDIPDFPKSGIIFKDITPLLADGELFRQTINLLKTRYLGKKIDTVIGIEARGFIFASALAYALGAGLVIIRKPRKLPYKTYKETYSLEYGTDTIEIHQDAVKPGQNVLLIDDVLATGGTISAALNLVNNNFKGTVEEVIFIIELDFLKGREKLKGVPVHSLIHY